MHLPDLPRDNLEALLQIPHAAQDGLTLLDILRLMYVQSIAFEEFIEMLEACFLGGVVGAGYGRLRVGGLR